MLFFPVRYPSGDWNPAGLAFDDAWFQAADGTKLHGWFLPHEQPKATVLYCHGNGGNVTYWAGAGEGAPRSGRRQRCWFSTTAATAGAKASRARRASWPMRGRPGPGWRRAGIAERRSCPDGPFARRRRGRRSGGNRRSPGIGARKHVHLDSRRGPKMYPLLPVRTGW